MKMRILALFALANITFFLAVSSAYSDVATLTDNTGSLQVSSPFVSNSTWQAQGFTTTGLEYRLTDVALLLSNSTHSTGTFALSIYTIASNTSPVWVADIRTGIDASTIGNGSGGYARYDVLGISISLSPSTPYFLVAKGTNLSANIQWGAAALITPSLHKKNTSGTWTDITTNPLIMSVKASEPLAVATPEPSTYLLLCISLGAVGIVRRKMDN